MTTPLANIRFRHGTSRAAATPGYPTLAIFADGKKMGCCNGGGYDMKGTVTGMYIATMFRDQLLTLTQPFDGLTFHDPNYNPGQAVAEDGDGRTVAEREETGDSLGLERLRATYAAASPVPTERHTVPNLDGGCGFSNMLRVLAALGMTLQHVKGDHYALLRLDNKKNG